MLKKVGSVGTFTGRRIEDGRRGVGPAAGLIVMKATHLVAAVTWVGGMLFFSFVVMPALRQSLPPPQRLAIIRSIGRRYRVLGWASVGILILTGISMVWLKGMPWDSGYGGWLSLKLFLVGAMLVLMILHDFVLAPKIAREGHQAAGGTRQVIVWLARANIIVVIGIVLLGVRLAEL